MSENEKKLQSNGAIISKYTNENGVIYEVRCRFCGKKLFDFEKICDENVAERNKNAIIIMRCTRTGCKKDNYLVL